MLRYFVIPGADLETLLVEWPQVMLRLLRMEARRLQTAGEVADLTRPFDPGDYASS